MISYAQNGEDVVLARVFHSRSGFYVDAGASSPDASSVTRHFYELGWRGINVEPRADAHALLESRRPRDINLRVALGDRDGDVELHLVGDDLDLSTTDVDDLEFLQRSGYRDYVVETVPMRTLSSILVEHGVKEFDFLKVDTEGSEEAVLRGLDFSRWRPRVIVVEAIRPWSNERVDRRWRHILESAGYREGLFDGLNLFFAPEEDSEALSRLVPASPLDLYRTAEVADLLSTIGQLRAALGLEGDDVERRTAAPSGPPPPMARFAVVGSPFSGGAALRRSLAGALGTEEVCVEHPGDVDWENLPDRFVVDLCWPRTPLLERSLTEAGAAIISPARHPLDVLGSIVAAGECPGASGVRDWLDTCEARRLLGSTASWWSSASVVRARYEDVQADPDSGLESLLVACGHKPPRGSVGLRWTAEPGGREVLPTEVVELAEHRCRDIIAALGYG